MKETATVNTTFLRVLGFTSFTAIASTSTASMHGGSAHPIDVAVVLDTTASMNSSLRERRRGHRERGDQARLREGRRPSAAHARSTRATPTLANCGAVTNGNVPQPLDEVSLYTFPGLTSPTAFTHDSTNARSNTCARARLPGQPPARRPPGTQPTTRQPRTRVRPVTVAATGGNFTLHASAAGRRRPRASLQRSAAARRECIQSALNATSQQHRLGRRTSTSPATPAVTYTTAGGQNLNNPRRPGRRRARPAGRRGVIRSRSRRPRTDRRSSRPGISTRATSATRRARPTTGATRRSRSRATTARATAAATLTSTSKLVQASSWVDVQRRQLAPQRVLRHQRAGRRRHLHRLLDQGGAGCARRRLGTEGDARS